MDHRLNPKRNGVLIGDLLGITLAELGLALPELPQQALCASLAFHAAVAQDRAAQLWVAELALF